MPREKSSIYPLNPPGSQTLVIQTANALTLADRLLVYASSVFVVGGVFWVPAFYIWAVRRFRAIPKGQVKRRALYGTLLLSLTALFVAGPHRNHRFGKCVHVKKWSLWKAWARFLALEIVADQGYIDKNLMGNQAILAVSPHGVFPFSLAFAAISDLKPFGKFRAVVASATDYFPWVRDLLKWVNAVNASKMHVNRALQEGSRIGLAPGGIAEMFEGYPKPGMHPDVEYNVVGRGIFKMAIKHKAPIIPIYCFGATKLLRRLQLPAVVEKISLMVRVSLVLFFGQWGLPIPFRQRLRYVMGKPIYPPILQHSETESGILLDPEGVLNEQTEEMVSKYCEEMVRIFDRHKEAYGWAQKTLKMLKR